MMQSISVQSAIQPWIAASGYALLAMTKWWFCAEPCKGRMAVADFSASKKIKFASGYALLAMTKWWFCAEPCKGRMAVADFPADIN